MFRCELRNLRTISNSMILVPLLNPKFAIELAARCARTSGSGALGSPAMRGRSPFAALAAVLLACAAAAPAAAQTAVDLQLVLAVDASGSVDQVRFDLQKQGYVAAFRHPRVIGAIQSGPSQSVAVIVMQWTGPALQVTAVPWTRISDAASANAFADAMERSPRALFGGGP